jgi:hypothetical protein
MGLDDLRHEHAGAHDGCPCQEGPGQQQSGHGYSGDQRRGEYQKRQRHGPSGPQATGQPRTARSRDTEGKYGQGAKQRQQMGVKSEARLQLTHGAGDRRDGRTEVDGDKRQSNE